MKKLLILGSIALLFSSCNDFFNKTISADSPDFEEVLVFHQFVGRTDTSIQLLLSRNFGVFENVEDYTKWFVKGAKVEWWENGQKVMDLQPAPEPDAYFYSGRFPAPLQTGNTYEIRVIHPSFDSIVVSQQMPAPVPELKDLKFKRNVVVQQYGQPTHEVSFTIQDDPNQDNYYAIAAVGTYENYIYIGEDPVTGQILFDTLYADGPAYFGDILDGNIQRGYGGYLLLDDRFFDGQTYNFRGQFSPSYYSSSVGDSATTYSIRIRSITQEYYRWLYTAQLQSDAQGNPLAEPVSVFTNFENGLGIFALWDEIIKPLE